jgi:hypothetical protein
MAILPSLLTPVPESGHPANSHPHQADSTNALPNPPVPLPWQPEANLYTHAMSGPPPTLIETVPSSCNWRGGIRISLFVENLPFGGSIYARFGGVVVSTVRRN